MAGSTGFAKEPTGHVLPPILGQQRRRPVHAFVRGEHNHAGATRAAARTLLGRSYAYLDSDADGIFRHLRRVERSRPSGEEMALRSASTFGKGGGFAAFLRPKINARVRGIFR